MTGRDLPILFSGPMVRALLAGTKTQTRRGMFKNDPPNDGRRAVFRQALNKWEWRTKYDNFGGTILPQPRYRVGDRLYVRERWRVSRNYDALAPRDLTPCSMTVLFEAGGSLANQSNGRWEPANYEPDPAHAGWVGKFRQGIHMPRWASRITLTVTDVRVQRLQDISDRGAQNDCTADGVFHAGLTVPSYEAWHGSGFRSSEKYMYRQLWEAINGPGSWDANPWVAAYSFTVALGNIDALARAA